MIVVHATLAQASADSLTGAAVVVIDVLRATSTVVTALAAGARSVQPVTSIARALAARHGPQVVIGGERNGVRPAGFDLGNSPGEYTPERVRGRDVILTTTNGTRAFARAARARRVVAGSLLNRAAVARALAEEPEVVLLCSGNQGTPSFEDLLAAGAIVDAMDAPASDLGLVARDAFRQERADLVRALETGRHGRRLLELDLGQDVALCARLDAYDLVPSWHDGRLTLRP